MKYYSEWGITDIFIYFRIIMIKLSTVKSTRLIVYELLPVVLHFVWFFILNGIYAEDVLSKF